MNTIALVGNGMKMPAKIPRGVSYRKNRFKRVSKNTKFNFLGDIIPIKNVSLSIGDIFLMTG